MCKNYEKAWKLFEMLWRGGEWAMLWTNPGKVSHWFRTAQRPTLPVGAAVNVYFGVNPCAAIPPTNARGQAAPPEAVRSQLRYVAALNCLFADFDCKAAPKAELLTRIRSLSPAPSVVVDSGGGYHCYWLLTEPLVLSDADTREYARRLLKRWVAYVGADPGAADLARVLRVPGTRNWKPDYAPAFPEVSFVRWLELRYSLHQLTGCLPPEPKRRQNGSGAATGDVLDIARAMIARAQVGEKHTTLVKASRLVGGYVAGEELDYTAALEGLIEIIDTTPAWERSDKDQAAIEAGLEYGAAAPLHSHREASR